MEVQMVENKEELKKADLEFLTDKRSIFDMIGLSLSAVVSLGVSFFLILSLLLMDYANVHTATYNYFYWLNAIPACGCFVFTLQYISFYGVSETLAFAISDYIILKSIFKLLEDCRFYFVSNVLGALFLTNLGYKSSRKFNSIFIFLFFVQLFAMCLRFEQLLIIGTLRVLVTFIPERNDINKKFIFNRLFLVTIFYFVDLAMNYRVFLELKFFEVDYLRLIFYAYTMAVLMYVAFYHKITYFASAYAFVNFMFIVTVFLYNMFNSTIFNYLDEYCLKMSVILGVSLIALSYICSRSKMVKTFPPKHQSIYDFAYFSLSNIYANQSYNGKTIEINLEHVLPHAPEGKEKILLRILDFKLIGGLYILNEIVRKEGKPVEIDSEVVMHELNNFGENFYTALGNASKYDDELYKNIESAIEDIVDANNDLVSKMMHFVGFRNIGLGFIFNRNSLNTEKNLMMASKIESEIMANALSNIVSTRIPEIEGDDE